MSLCAEDFVTFFKAVHGHGPFPWQAQLARQVVETRCWPTLLDLPTGTGKTAAIDIAVFHLACEGGRGPARRAPLRILFVIDRRIVVDAASERAKKIAQALARPEALRSDGTSRSAEELAVLRAIAAALREFAGPEAPPLDVVRLRGGVPQERDWARSPAQPLVAVSTVDQVGSRLLFRGYGVSPRMWPVHAGLVGSDALWLLDEVHLSQPLEQTLEAIVTGHLEGGGRVLAAQPRLAPFGVVRLSATPGKKEPDAFSLTADDRAHPKMRPRLGAHKIATLKQVDKEPADAFVEAALHLLRLSPKPASTKARRKKQTEVVEVQVPLQPLRVAVVVNRVDLARRTFEWLRTNPEIKGAGEGALDKAEVVLLTGRVRPLDRDRIMNSLKKLNLFADPDRGEPEKPVILVATQTIEAGADLDVDALVTEIAPLDALRQRFGRLDRLGLRHARGEVSHAVILHPKGKPSKDNDWAAIGRIYGEAAYETKEWLASLDGTIDFGIDALEPKLSKVAASCEEDGRSKLEMLIADRADAPVLLAPYADLWATTSPAPVQTPEPALFLHGPKTEPDVQII